MSQRALFAHLVSRMPRQRLPEGWRICRVDLVATRGSGHTPKKDVPRYWNGDIAWLSLKDLPALDRVYIGSTRERISEEGIENSSAVLHPPGVVVLSRDAAVGKSAVTTTPMAVSQHFLTWECGPQIVNLYLYYWFQFIKSELKRIASGSTIKTIGLPYFRKLEVLLPSVPEQESIATTLRQWDGAITVVEGLLGAKRGFKRSLVQDLLTGKRRFREFEVDARETRSLGELLRESRVPCSNGATARRLTVKLYGRGVVASTNPRRGSSGTQYYRRSAGQFIYSKLDFLNGACGIVPPELDGFETTLDLPCFEVSPELDVRWLAALASQPWFYARQIGLAVGGRKAKRLNSHAFLKIKVQLPRLPEQRKIADFIGSLGVEIELLERLHIALDGQRRGVMELLLAGQIRIPA